MKLEPLIIWENTDTEEDVAAESDYTEAEANGKD